MSRTPRWRRSCRSSTYSFCGSHRRSISMARSATSRSD
jgi:hypothetical protein